ncbi:MAG: hypothetical protein NTW21_32565 [Verrucomicrobia bacterium]|nr:hypothetical protein [Verrucomicrobiota bacterium]
MPSELLELVLPDWGSLDTVRRSPVPFGLWTIGDQCLLHHWLDHAVNQGASTVRVFAADRPAAVRRVLEESTLWPVKTEFTAIAATAAAPAGALHADWLPGEPSPPAPTSGWELLARAAAMEEVWLDRMAGEPDFPLVSIGFACRIHPEAELIPPYFIGDEVFIGPGCEIGPYAVIGQGSVISGANRIAHSQVAAHSFVGPVTALENCLLDRGILFNLKHRARLDQLEPHLLATLEKSPSNVPLRDRLRAFYLFLRLGGARASARSRVTFDGRTLPGDPAAGLSNRAAWLPLVWQGKLPLYGVLPRTKEQFEALEPDWQQVLRHAPIGVFSYADCQGCHRPADPAEAIHAVYQASLPPATLLAAMSRFTRNLKAADLTSTSPLP